MAHLHNGSMTIGRPLPRPLPPINDSFNHSTNELKFGGHRSKYASNSQLVNNHHGNRDTNTNSHLNNLNFATAPRNLNINSQRYAYQYIQFIETIFSCIIRIAPETCNDIINIM